MHSAASPMTITLNWLRSSGVSVKVGQQASLRSAVDWVDLGLQKDTVVAGVAGQVYLRESTLYPEGLLLRHCSFVSAEGQGLECVRIVLTNHGQQAVEVGELALQLPRLSASCKTGDKGSFPWRVVRMSRHKNDIPGVYQPGATDTDARHARVDSSEFRAGAGVVSGGDDSSAQTPVKSEALILVSQTDSDANMHALAVLGQTEHLSRIETMSAGAQHGELQLRVIGEFDRLLLQPGQSIATHWIATWSGDEPGAMIERFGDLVEKVTGLGARPRLGPAPTMICSWYFYGLDFTEKDLCDDLSAYQRNRFPADVFLIDNGWMDCFGSWNAGERFASGMQHAADQIKAAGLLPGIWTAPFVIAGDAPVLKEHPELAARTLTGERVLFAYKNPARSDLEYGVIDPTSPYAAEYFREMYQRLRAWGYVCHKFDFLRALVNNPAICFYDRSFNRAKAYRLGMELVRKAVGEDAYILACGGLYEGSLRLADGQRVGSDVKGRWHEPDPQQPGYLVRIKQNVFRAWTRRWWHTDPDALQLRRRSEPFRGRTEFAHLSQGAFTDEEALTITANQYLGGGIVCISEHFPQLDEDRRELLRLVIPSINTPAKILDWNHPVCPTRFLTSIAPRAVGLKPWWTLTLCNWAETPGDEMVRLADIAQLPRHDQWAVFEMHTQRFLGEFARNDAMTITVPAHGCRVLRLCPSANLDHVLLGTDLHLSGGGVEIAQWQVHNQSIQVRLDTPWQRAVTFSLGVRSQNQLCVHRFTIPSDCREFVISLANLVSMVQA